MLPSFLSPCFLKHIEALLYIKKMKFDGPFYDMLDESVVRYQDTFMHDFHFML